MAMQQGTVPGIGKPVSRLAQGIGAAVRKGADGGFQLLDAFLEEGVTVFDTARIYGTTDRFLGDWIRSRDNREQVVVLGKGAHHGGGRQRVTPEDIEADLFKSLDDLQTDYIDLYILHRDDPSVPVGPIVNALNAHRKAGRIRAFGVSNWTHTRLAEANDYARIHNLTPFAVSNPQLSLAEQIKEPWENCVSIGGPSGAGARAYYAETQLPLFTWSSLAGGFLSGKYNRDSPDDNSLAYSSYASADNFTRLERATEIAQQKNVSLPQIALAYVMNQPLNVFALVGSANREELQANIAALDIALSPQELAYLDLRTDAPR